MKLDLPAPDTWYLANEQARNYLGVADDPAITVQVYLGVRHALWEVTLALAQTYPHRRTIGYSTFSGPEGELIALQFAKEGFTVRSLNAQEFDEPKAWLETAAKQMLCLISAHDDPATGELIQTNSHVAAMKDQRIFRVLVSHSYHRFEQLTKPGPYEVHILSLAPNLAVAVMGDRAKLIPPIASHLQWQNLKLSGRLQPTSPAEVGQLKQVLSEFISLLPSGAELFAPTSETLPDRAVLIFSDVEGSSLITRTAEKLGVVINGLGEAGELETLSLCRWQDPKQLEWLQQKGFTSERLRGTVIVSSALLTRLGASKVAEALAQAHQELLALQAVT